MRDAGQGLPLTWRSYDLGTGGGDHGPLGDGELLTPWQVLAEQLALIPPEELDQRLAQAQRDLQDQDAFIHDEKLNRRLDPDPLPLLLDAATFARLSAGIDQRARLIDALLADLYGEQRLLREGILAPAAVLGDGGYLRPCHGLRPAGGRWLSTYSCDLACDATGRWLVRSDRTQAPNGDGRALANRLTCSRILPEAFQALHVRRHAGHATGLRRHLGALAPGGRDNPRVVILTPGPYSPSYGEHSFLARHLGYTLVEGGDLAVHGGGVYLKTLSGLHQVDVILRRQDDDWCDPLELRNDSTLGVPGLVQAARSGQVAIANALGSGIAESPALLPALAPACQMLLGESLLLPSVETWWGAESLDRIEAQLDQLVLLPVLQRGRGQRYLPAGMSRAVRAAFLEQLRARPHAWAAQPAIASARTPVWHRDGVRASGFSVRLFAHALDGGYSVLPGGVCTPEPAQGHQVEASAGSPLKEVWVLSEGPETAELAPLTQRQNFLQLRRGSFELPSRVADNLFWIGRYAERCECAARIARALTRRIGDRSDTSIEAELACLAEMARAAGMVSPESADAQAVMHEMVGGADSDSTLRGSLDRLHRAGLAVRDRLSNDTARILAQLEASRRRLGDPVASAHDGDPVIDEIISGLCALAGMSTENTTRGPGWRFLDSGRRLERALVTAELLRTAIGNPVVPGSSGLAVVLEVADSTITYRSRYLSSLQAHAVLDLLLTDDSNPRSINFQLEILVGHFEALPKDPDVVLPSRTERLALGARTWLRLVEPADLCRSDENGGRPALEHVLSHLASDMGLLSEHITTQYLSHGLATRILPRLGC